MSVFLFGYGPLMHFLKAVPCICGNIHVTTYVTTFLWEFFIKKLVISLQIPIKANTYSNAFGNAWKPVTMHSKKMQDRQKRENCQPYMNIKCPLLHSDKSLV